MVQDDGDFPEDEYVQYARNLIPVPWSRKDEKIFTNWSYQRTQGAYYLFPCTFSCELETYIFGL